MANSENNNDLTNSINNRTEEQIATVLEEKQLKAKWRDDIKANSSAMNYLKSKGDYVVENFISYYVDKKYVWHVNQSYKVEKAVEDEWIEKCQDHLKIMIRKKIVDLQCLWNANLVQVPQVETSADFNYAFGDPLSCTFIEPLTLKEIKLYQDFLLQDGVVLAALNTEAFLFYDKLKAKHNADNPEEIDEEDQSKWYDYHYERTDTKNLLDLPSIRREKERFYYLLALEAIESKKEPVAPVSTITEPSGDRPFLNYYDRDIIKRFVNQFETPDYQKKHKYYALEHKEESKLDFKMSYYFDQMIAKQEYIPMKANDDYKAAIVKSYNDYCIAKIVEALPIAHELYLYKAKHGLHEKEDRNPFGFKTEKTKKMILEGRVLNGEPRDFDF